VVVASASSTPTAKAAAATSTSRTISLWFGLIDGQGPPTQICPIQGRDCFIRFAGIRHFYKPEAARTTGIPVGYKSDFFHCAVRFKDLP
jgi:hypothetical protein